MLVVIHASIFGQTLKHAPEKHKLCIRVPGFARAALSKI